MRLQKSDFVGLVALVFGLLFAAGMFFFAVSLTETSREHYQKKLRWSKVDFSSISFGGDESRPKPQREKNSDETLKFYEIDFPIMILPLLIFGFVFMRLTFGTLPKRNPLDLSDFARRDMFGMVCLILLSTAFFLLYIWFLRIGFL